MSLRDLKLTPLGVYTDNDALTNEKLEEKIKELKSDTKKEKVAVKKDKKDGK